jgi:hypothetical protein
MMNCEKKIGQKTLARGTSLGNRANIFKILEKFKIHEQNKLTLK